MTRTRRGAHVVAVVVLVLAVVAGAGLVSERASANALGLSVDESGIQPGDSFTFSLYDDATSNGAEQGDYIFVVVDENNDGLYNDGEAYTRIASEDLTTLSGQVFPASNTSGLDGTYDVHAIERNSLSANANLSTGSTDTLAIDGSAPYVSEVNVTNPSGQDVKIELETNEPLNGTTVDLSGAESATFALGDFSETNNSGTYTYELTYAGSSEGDYTAKVTSATDAVGNDAASNQTATELSDSVTVDTVPPGITGVEAEVGNDTVVVSFNESVEASDGSALSAANFTYGNTESGGATDVSLVDHTVGSTTATLTLDAPVSRTDLGNDTVAATAGEITDGFGNAAPTTAVTLADTQTPSAPTGASGLAINASNDGSYDVSVTLPDDHEAGTVKVTLTNGNSVSATQYVASEDDGDSVGDRVTFTGLDVSSLDDGAVSVDAMLTDDGGNANQATGLATVTKDTDAPGVSDASITNATIGTYDAGTEQTVTVTFDEAVNTSAAPTVEITGLNRSYAVSGSFDDATTWTGTVTIQDDNEAATATIEVSGVEDPVGNDQSPATDTSNTFEVDTTGPAKPESTEAGNVTASNETNYNVTVNLVSDSTADEVEVRISDGTTNVTANKSIAPGTTTATVSGIDVSGLTDGDVTVTARALENGYPNTEGFTEPTTVEKDTDRPGVDSVTVGDGVVNDSDAGTTQQVTVTFDEAVNTSAAPTVEITGLNRSYAVSGSFDDATTWTGTVTIQDDNEAATATIEVSGVEDPVGNELSTDASNTFAVDTQTPAISAFSATRTGGGAVEVSFDSDESLAAIDVAVTGADSGTLTASDFTESGSPGSYTYTATYTPSADDKYTATLDTAADGAGNDGAASESDDATVDTTDPVFSNAAPTDTVTNDQPAISVDVTDATAGVNASSLAVTVTDSAGTKLNAVGTSDAGVNFDGTTLTVDTATAGTTLADGSVSVTVDANDTVGNANSTTFSFTVDTAAPTFSDPSPTTTVTDDQSTISVNVTDATAGVDASTIEVTLSNASGDFLTDAGTGTDGVSVDGETVTVDPAGTGVPTLPNGTVTVNVSAADAVGQSASTEFAFGVDTPPEIADFAATDAAGMDAEVSFDSTDELAAVSVDVTGAETAELTLANFSKSPNGAGGYEYTATYTGSTDGDYTFTLETATDGRTDGATGQSDTVLVDETEPAVTVSAPTGGETFAGGETATVSWTATDSVGVASNAVTIEYSTDGGSTWNTVVSGTANDGSYDWTVPALDDDAVRLRVSADDTSGNTGTDQTDGTFAVDSTAPTVSAFSVSNPSGQTVEVSFDSDEALDSVAVAVSGPSPATLNLGDFTESGSPGSYTYTATYNSNTDGSYSATLNTAADLAGNDGAGGESGSTTVDTTAPAISDFSASNPSGQTVEVSFDSDEALASLNVTLSGPESATLTLADFSESGGTYTATYAASTDGTYDATLNEASDGEGNDAGDGQTDSATVDTTPPVVSNYTVTNPAGHEVRVHFDTDEPVSTIQVSISGAETATLTTSSPTTVDGSYVVTYAGTTDGDYTATLNEASDGAGNDGASGESGSVSIVTEAPVISGFSVSNPSGQTVEVSFDSDETLANVSVALSGATTATLTEADFTESGNTYTATYDAGADGSVTATLNEAADAGDHDGATGQSDTVAVGGPSGAPAITDFSASNPSAQIVEISFDSNQSLASLGVAVTGPNSTTLTLADFSESGGTYTASFDASADGDYTATLYDASNAGGADGSNGESATVTVDTPSDGGNGADGSDGGDSAGSGNDNGDDTGGSPLDTGVVPNVPTLDVSVSDGNASVAGTSVTVENADAFDPVAVDFANATGTGVNVTRLNVTVDEPMDYNFDVNTSADAPADAPTFDGRAVGFVEVEHSVADGDVAGATFTLRVDADRFEATGVTPEDATVYRHHDGDWRALDTDLVERDGDDYVLRADTPGFSVFAVGVRDSELLSVAGASVSRSAVETGDAVTVSATVENTGDWEAARTLAVRSEDGVVATRTVAVSAGDTATFTFDVTLSEPGDYRLSVANTSAGTLAVYDDLADRTTQTTDRTTSPDTTEQSDPTATGTPTTATTDTPTTATTDTPTEDSGASGGNVPGLGALGALLAVALAFAARAR